jgi:hypothetical protein
VLLELRADQRFVAKHEELDVAAISMPARSSRNDYCGTDIATHRVQCDPWRIAHRSRLLGLQPLSLDGPDLTAVIMATGRAQIVRQAKLAAIRAFLIIYGLQRVVTATHVPLRGRSFSLGDGHPGTYSIRLEFMMRASAKTKANSHTGRGPGGRTLAPERCRL